MVQSKILTMWNRIKTKEMDKYQISIVPNYY